MATCFASDAISVRAALDYMTNKDGKQRDADKVLATGVECSPETANTEMQTMRKFYGQDCGLKAYTYLQSFSPEDMQGGLTMAQANEVGRATLADFMAARGYAAGSYQAVVCTQCDGDAGLLHNHFIVNNIDLGTGQKLKMHQALWDFRAASDRQCRAHGLSVVGERGQERGCDIRYTGTEKAMLQKGKLPWKERIRLALEAEMPLSRNADELCQRLAARGVGMELRGRKSVVYTIEGNDGKQKRARGRVLGDRYDRAAVDALGRTYDGRAAELHVSWASVVQSHPELRDDARRVARRAVVVCDDAAARAGYRVPQRRRRRRAQNGQASAEARAMSACAFLVQDGMALPLRLGGQALQTVGRVVGAVPVVGAPVRLVLCGAGGAAENVGKRMEDGSRQFRQRVRELDARASRNRRPEECGGGRGGAAVGQQDTQQRDGRGLVQDALAEIARSRGLPPVAVRLDGDDDDELRDWAMMSELEKDEIRNKELARSI